MTRHHPQSSQTKEPSSANGCPASDFAATFDPFDPEYLQDPYPIFARARKDEPVFYSPRLDYWVVSRRGDIKQIFQDTDSFSAAAASETLTPMCPAAEEQLQDVGFVPRPNLVDEDPPLHTRRRKLLMKGITPARVAELEPTVRRFVNEALDKIVDRGRADLVADLAFEVPALVAFVLMGVPEAEIHRVKGYASRFALLNWGRPSEEEQVALASNFGEYYKYARDHVQQLMQEPGEDYLSNAIKAWRSSAKEDLLFDEYYLYFLMQGHLFAAHETTTNAAANGFRALLEHRGQWEALCADPSLIPNAVEEVLRYSSSVPVWRRVTTREVTVGGIDLPSGAHLLLLTGSANHDGEYFTEPETFDIARDNAHQHMAFGWGRHYCLGHNLARMELRVMYEETARRLPGLRLVEGQGWSYSANTSFRGPQQVLVEFEGGNQLH